SRSPRRLKRAAVERLPWKVCTSPSNASKPKDWCHRGWASLPPSVEAEPKPIFTSQRRACGKCVRPDERSSTCGRVCRSFKEGQRQFPTAAAPSHLVVATVNLWPEP